MWTCGMLPGSLVVLCWRGNFWSRFFSPEQCWLRRSLLTLHKFSPACFYVGELTGREFSLLQCHSSISLCSKHRPFFFPCSNQSVCLNTQYKSDWTSGKLWACDKITLIQLPVGRWARVKIKVTDSSVWCPLGLESCLSLTPLSLPPAACPVQAQASSMSLLISLAENWWGKKRGLIFFCKASELSWLTEVSDECQG